ncbi:MAG: heavy-metal-associated domain-containing protein [Nitrospiraceae bacterium]
MLWMLFLAGMMVSAVLLGVTGLEQSWAQGTSSSAADEQLSDTITVKIEGWTCRSCEKDIRRALLAVPGVRAADVSYPRGGAIVSVEPGEVSTEQLIKAVESASTLLSTYRASVIPNGTLPQAGTSEDRVGSLFKKLFQ